MPLTFTLRQSSGPFLELGAPDLSGCGGVWQGVAILARECDAGVVSDTGGVEVLVWLNWQNGTAGDWNKQLLCGMQ